MRSSETEDTLHIYVYCGRLVQELYIFEGPEKLHLNCLRFVDTLLVINKVWHIFNQDL